MSPRLAVAVEDLLLSEDGLAMVEVFAVHEAGSTPRYSEEDVARYDLVVALDQAAEIPTPTPSCCVRRRHSKTFGIKKCNSNLALQSPREDHIGRRWDWFGGVREGRGLSWQARAVRMSWSLGRPLTGALVSDDANAGAAAPERGGGRS